MRIAFGLLAASLLVLAAEAGKKCSVTNAVELSAYSGAVLKMKVPCKYHLIKQRCGRYNVVVTPGNRYLHPSYIIDTVWLSVYDTEHELLWKGRTTNRVAGLYLIMDDREAFNKVDGSMETEDLFGITKTFKNFTMATKDGDFSLSYGPYDFAGNKDGDSGLEFECNADMDEVRFPTQFCGSGSRRELWDRTSEVFNNRQRYDLIVLHDIFIDDSIVQMNANCRLTTEIMTGATEETREEAMRACHLFLDSSGHRQCALKQACDPMEVFVNCVQFVTGGYNKTDPACQVVGEAIDLCHNFADLSAKIEEVGCYKGLLTSEDNPFFLPNRKQKQN